MASKDEPTWQNVHDACCSHMETLVSKLIYRGSNSVGAVEALLILAEWVPQRMHSSSSVGRGEEDHGAWMHVGIAIRLGYLQRLEQTGLTRNDKCTGLDERKRLAWAGCYMSDRQISIRLGKGFWSRGPGPATLMTATDFPSLQQKPAEDDLALLIQANMELTQLFTNSHDILYSSTSHREHLYAGGEYVKYIDDFTSALRKWKLVWGAVSFTGHVRATLNLSYDFLRLYINAFAFQANINRAIEKARKGPNGVGRQSLNTLFSNIASLPDARFLYEAIDAANSLLSTINNYVDPENGLRFMPFKYYLYVIYAAVFLFKARTAGAIDAEASNSVRRAVTVAIERFQKSAVNSNSLGHRYSRLLHLLWRKSPPSAQAPAATPHNAVVGPLDPMLTMNAGMNIDFDPLSGFSWRDLGSVGQFITSDSDGSDSLLFADVGYLAPSAYPLSGDANEDVYDQLWTGNGAVF